MTFNHGVEGSNPSRRTQHSYRGMDRVNEVGFHTPKRLKCSVRVDIVARLEVERLSTSLRSVKGRVWVQIPPSHLNEKQSEILLSFRARLTIALFSFGGACAIALHRAHAKIHYTTGADYLSSVFLKKFVQIFIPKFVQFDEKNF